MVIETANHRHEYFKVKFMPHDLSSIDKLLVTGLPRSGTTFFGNILGSCRRVEYFFEPAMVNKLLAHAGDIDELVWKEIFEDYCLNELLASSLSGRRLNFNSYDDSYVLNYKSKAEVGARLKKSWRAAEIAEISGDYVFAFKTPGVSNYLHKVLSLYPEWCLVIVFRKYEDILKSILDKGWFDNDNRNFISPFVSLGGLKIPAVISDYWYDVWGSLNVIERAMVYMNEQLEHISALKNYTRVDYNDFIENSDVLLRSFEILQVEPTCKTYELLKTIKPNGNDNSYLLESSISYEILAVALRLKIDLDI